MTNAASQRRIARPSGRAIDYTGLGNIEIFPVCSHKDVTFVWRCTILCRRAAFVCRHYSDCLICRYHLTTWPPPWLHLFLLPQKTKSFVKNTEFCQKYRFFFNNKENIKNTEFCEKCRILSKTQNSGVVEITSEVITILTTLVPSEDMVLFSVLRDIETLNNWLGLFPVPWGKDINKGGFFSSSKPKH